MYKYIIFFLFEILESRQYNIFDAYRGLSLFGDFYISLT